MTLGKSFPRPLGADGKGISLLLGFWELKPAPKTRTGHGTGTINKPFAPFVDRSLAHHAKFWQRHYNKLSPN
jgi:hypothetical protein